MTVALPPAKLFIAGDWRASADGRAIDVVNPSDGAAFTTIARGLAADIDAAVAAARAAATELARPTVTGEITPGNSTALRNGTMISASSGIGRRSGCFAPGTGRPPGLVSPSSA